MKSTTSLHVMQRSSEEVGLLHDAKELFFVHFTSSSGSAPVVNCSDSYKLAMALALEPHIPSKPKPLWHRSAKGIDLQTRELGRGYTSPKKFN